MQSARHRTPLQDLSGQCHYLCEALQKALFGQGRRPWFKIKPFGVNFVLAAKIFVRLLLIESGQFHRFAYYCWAVGGSFMVYSLITS